MKNNSIIAKILIIFLIAIIFIMPHVQASGDTFDPDKYKPGDTSDTSEITNMGSKIVGALTTVGIVVSVISLAIIGVKYMFGSLENRAEFKKELLPYVIGLTMVATISTIVQIIYNVAQGI